MVALCLGTAQFGLPYGVSNAAGQVPAHEVKKILQCALDAGVFVLDTAPAYGTSEKVLGDAGVSERFKTVSKTPQFRTREISASQADNIKKQLEASLTALGVSSLHALMVHWPGDLLAPGADHVWRVLADAKAQGLVQAIGVSVYTPDELMTIMERYPCDITQVPLNVLDQRFIKSGVLKKMKAGGGAVFARSAFLQGLLLMDPLAFPEKLDAARQPVAKFANAAKDAGLSALQASLGFIQAQNDVDYVVCGVTNVGELAQIIEALDQDIAGKIDYRALASDNLQIIDPRLW